MSIIISVIPFVIAGTISALSGAAAVGSSLTDGEATGEQQEHVLTFATIIRNETLLNKALVNLGAQHILHNTDTVSGNIDQFHIVFEKTDTGLFNIKFIGEVAEKDAVAFLQQLQEEYGKVVQEYVYVKLKEKANEKGLTLEQERVQENQSIVLTFNING